MRDHDWDGIIIIFRLFYSFKCKRCVNNIQVKLPPEESDCTSDLSQWYHCTNNKGLPDIILSQAWDVARSVSFVFHHRSGAAEVKTEPPAKDAKNSRFKDEFDDGAMDEDTDDDANDEDFVL